MRLKNFVWLFLFCVSIFLISVGVPISSGQNYAVHTTMGPPQSATLTANLASTSYTIPANFVGWSVENQDLIGGYYASTQTSFIGLVKLLGANGIIRIGGITSDTASAPGLPALTQPIATSYAGYLSAIGAGWTTIYGLDACDNSSAHALTQVGFLITALGVNNVVFAVGNEPPFEVCGFTQGQWTTVFNAYQTAITGSFSTAKFAQPEVTNNSLVQTFVTSTTIGVAGTTYVTTHWYPYGIGTTPTADMLAHVPYNNDTLSSVNSFAFKFNSVFATGKLMMSEDNTRAGCGLLGVSDRLMAANYYLNTAIVIANDGWIGYQPHNAILTCYGQAHNGYYNAFVLQGDGGFSPSPIFYGFYLFSQIEGQQTVAVTKTGTADVSYIATNGNTGGNTNMLVVNNSAAFPAKITPSQSSAFTTIKILLLNGKACDDASPTIGGSVIGESGVWTGSYSSIPNGGSFTINPCGAALVKMQ